MCSRVLTLVALFVAGRAHADDTAAARQHFQEGTKLYDLGQYLEAAQEYEAAYRIKDDPVLLFNIGQAYRGAHRYADSIRAYRSFLRHVPESEQRPQVELRIREMQQLLEQQQSTEQQPPVGTAAPDSIGKTNAPRSPEVTAPKTEAARTTGAAPTPVYKKWWLWTIVGVVVVGAVVAGVTVGVVGSRDSFNPSLGKFGPSALAVQF